MTAIYTLPRGVLASIGWSWVWQKKRIFRDDARACLASHHPEPKYIGLENIPVEGPCLVTFNHYYRPGFNVMWLAMALASVLPPETGMVMTGELTYPGKWYAALGMPVSHYVLKRLARVYGFISMPPMPPRPKDVAGRAGSVRAVLSWLEKTPNPMLMLAPEGGDQPGGLLTWPPPGVGRFIDLMAGRGMRILPAAGWEKDDRLYVRFGAAYQLNLPPGSGRSDLDRQVSGSVMRAIAELLPVRLRGDFKN